MRNMASPCLAGLPRNINAHVHFTLQNGVYQSSTPRHHVSNPSDLRLLDDHEQCVIHPNIIIASPVYYQGGYLCSEMHRRSFSSSRNWFKKQGCTSTTLG